MTAPPSDVLAPEVMKKEVGWILAGDILVVLDSGNVIKDKLITDTSQEWQCGCQNQENCLSKIISTFSC